MTLPASGQIASGQIRTEGHQTGTWDINAPIPRTIAHIPGDQTPIKFSDFYGKLFVVRSSFGDYYRVPNTIDGNGAGSWTFLKIANYFPWIQPGDSFSIVAASTAAYFGHPSVYTSGYQYQVNGGNSNDAFNLVSRGYYSGGGYGGHAHVLVTYYGGSNDTGLDSVGVSGHYGYGGSRSGSAMPDYHVLGLFYGVSEEGRTWNTIGDFLSEYPQNADINTGFIGDDRNGNFPYWPGGSFSPSDYRIKIKVTGLSSSKSIKKLKQLKPRQFAFKDNPDVMVYGFIAHEVQEVIPEAVMGDRDGTDIQLLDQSKIVPVLTSALQEALKKIDKLEERIKRLEKSNLRG